MTAARAVSVVGLLVAAASILQGCVLLHSSTKADSTTSQDAQTDGNHAPALRQDPGLIPAATEIDVDTDRSNDGTGQPLPSRSPSRQLVIRLAAQELIYSKNGEALHRGPVSTGRRGYGMPTGSFRVLSKQRHKVSNRYRGAGGRPAAMPYSIQFLGHYFIHQGKLPRYPASHFCVRLRRSDARLLFGLLKLGDPILIRP